MYTDYSLHHYNTSQLAQPPRVNTLFASSFVLRLHSPGAHLFRALSFTGSCRLGKLTPLRNNIVVFGNSSVLLTHHCKLSALLAPSTMLLLNDRNLQSSPLQLLPIFTNLGWLKRLREQPLLLLLHFHLHIPFHTFSTLLAFPRLQLLHYRDQRFVAVPRHHRE